MEFEEEVNQLKAIQKQTLKNYVAFASQYNHHWAEYLDASDKIQQIRARQILRAEEGFLHDQHPVNTHDYRQMDEYAQLEVRQRYEKQMLEHQNDERTVNALNQQLNLSKGLAQAILKHMNEVLDVVGHQSEVIHVASKRQIR